MKRLIFALVAQWIEHCFPKAGVAGSIPAGGTCDLAYHPTLHGQVATRFEGNSYISSSPRVAAS